MEIEVKPLFLNKTTLIIKTIGIIYSYLFSTINILIYLHTLVGIKEN